MLKTAKNIFIIGIKGVAMANLAIIFKKMGKSVTGSDVSEEFITDELLKENNIKYTIGFSSHDLPKNTDLIIYSAAHGGTNNPQAVEAKKQGISVISQAQILSELIKQFQTTIAVCGCHGKTTTASLLAYSLIKLGVKPSYLVGSSKFNNYWGGDYQDKKYFVIEADEYGVNPPTDKTPKFHVLKPNYIICTNIDFDHPDVYKNLKETKLAFFKFFQSIDKSKQHNLILCGDDLNMYRSIDKSIQDQYVIYGFNKNLDYQINNVKTDENGSSFELSGGLFHTSLFGEKNISNVAGVITCLLQLGFTIEQIKKAIAGFIGAKRRFEQVYYGNNIYLYDDYAHHPKEIEATIEAAGEKFPKRRLIVIFQPHTYSRTQALLKDFAKSLSLADEVFILPIFPSARENSDNFNVSSKDIVKNGNKNKLVAVDDHVQLINRLYIEIKKGDVIFTMGAGDVYKLKNEIIHLITNYK